MTDASAKLAYHAHNYHTHGAKWTEDKLAMLRALWTEGKSASQIASALGPEFTRNGVIGKVRRLGLAGRPSPIGNGTRKTASRRKPRERTIVLRAVPAPLVERIIDTGPSQPSTAYLAGVALLGPYPGRTSRALELVQEHEHDEHRPLCRYSHGAIPSEEFHFCGAPALIDEPTGARTAWCEVHDRLVHSGKPPGQLPREARR